MATSPPAPRWQRLEHDERRRQILDCAGRLFSERTYASVSTSDIAREAGVARGLLHHYFGTKRDLYLEVVRELARMPSNPVPHRTRDLRAGLEDSVENWLTMLERNRGTWLAAIGGRGLGRDPEVEQILDAAREQAANRLIVALRRYRGDEAPSTVRALVRAYAEFAEAASIEWLERGRLTRRQTHAALVQGFFSIVGDVHAAVEAAAEDGSGG